MKIKNIESKKMMIIRRNFFPQKSITIFLKNLLQIKIKKINLIIIFQNNQKQNYLNYLYHGKKLLKSRKKKSLKYPDKPKVFNCFRKNKQFNFNPKYGRIVRRIIQQFKRYARIAAQLVKYTKNILVNNELQMKKIFNGYKDWPSILFENRILIHNFMKQLQTIPIMTNSLFGSKQNQYFYGYKQQSLEERTANFMKVKCEKCYDFNQKSKYVVFKNNQIKPILKCLEYLLRDGNKRQSLMSII